MEEEEKARQLQAESDRVWKAWREAQDQRNEEMKLRREKREKERTARVSANWGSVMLAYIKRQDLARKDFKSRYQEMRQEVKAEMRKWRGRIVWDHKDGKAIRTAPTVPLPKTDDEDLRWLWQRLWGQEQTLYREEDEEIQRLQDLEAKKWGSITEWSNEEIWDEMLKIWQSVKHWDPRKYPKQERRMEELRSERCKRRYQDQSNLHDTVPAMEEEMTRLQIWSQKYKDLDSQDKHWREVQLCSLTQKLKVAKEKQEKEDRARQARLIQEEAQRKRQRDEIEAEARRQAEIQAAIQKAAEDRVRRADMWASWAEQLKKQEVRYRVKEAAKVHKEGLAWREKRRWVYLAGTAYRENPPIPDRWMLPLGGWDWWRDLWDLERERAKEEDDKELKEQQEIEG
jgi:hypothetical protein